MEPGGLRPGKQTFIGLGVHQNDVRPDAFDAFPGDHIVVIPAQKPHKPAGTGDNDGHHIAGWDFDFHIRNEAQAAAVGNADDFLAV